MRKIEPLFNAPMFPKYSIFETNPTTQEFVLKTVCRCIGKNRKWFQFLVVSHWKGEQSQRCIDRHMTNCYYTMLLTKPYKGIIDLNGSEIFKLDPVQTSEKDYAAFMLTGIEFKSSANT